MSGRRSTPPSSASASAQMTCSARALRRRPLRGRRPGVAALRLRQVKKMTAIVEAKGLTKSFGATHALDGVSFAIETGRIVGLIGPNGAGKTTALKAILGLTPFGGELKV